MALAGVSMGSEVTLLTSTLKADVDDIATTSSYTKLEVSAWNLYNTASNEELTSMTTGSAFQTSLRPEINVGTGNSWTLTFTISNDTDENFSLSSITLNAFTFNSGGNGQYNTTSRDFIFAVYEEGETRNSLYVDEEPRSLTGPATPNSTTISEAPHELTFDFSKELELVAQSSVTLSLVVSDGSAATDDGCYIGATSMSIAGQVIPEPTTATLSLLALAGLAARRRRASR